jgi:hypothetical protein
VVLYSREKGIRGCCRPPFRGLGALAIRGWAAQCHGADTGLIAQCYTAAGMSSPRELVKQRRDAVPGRARVAACVLRCQGIKCPHGGRSVDDVRAGALERGGHRPRGRSALERGGHHPRGRSALERGRSRPRGRVALERGGPYSRGVPLCRPGGPQGLPGR